MIKVTNDTAHFFEKEQGEIIIYGAGNAGYWVGYYMNRCGIDFSCYIDKKIYHEGAFYNKKPIFKPEKLSGYKDRSIRIIVSPHDYEVILTELLWMEHTYGFHALCLVPRYVHVTTKQEKYHINRFLAYFRRKLFKGEVPTIISNNCSAGFIYQLMDMMMISPTINTGIHQDDFIKLCKNPHYYLEQEMKEIYWERPYGNPQHEREMPVGVVDDISIMFGHVDSSDGLLERWNRMRKMVNWNRIIFIGCDYDAIRPFSIKNEREFMNLKAEHLLIVMRSAGLWGEQLGFHKIFLQQNYLAKLDSAIENYFDLLGWLNREYQDKSDGS